MPIVLIKTSPYCFKIYIFLFLLNIQSFGEVLGSQQNLVQDTEISHILPAPAGA